MNQALVQRQHHSLVLPQPTGNLEQYIQSVRSIPILTAEEERELALRLRDLTPDERAVLRAAAPILEKLSTS